MNNIEVLGKKPTKHYSFKKINYQDILAKKERIKAYNHKYYIDAKKYNGQKWISYYHRHKEYIKQQNIARKPRLPTTFKKENKSIFIDLT